MNWCRDVEDKIAILGFNVIAKKYLALNWMVIKKKKNLFLLENLEGFLMQFIK